MTHSLGCLPDREASRQRDEAECRFEPPSLGTSPAVLQHVARISNQLGWPSCVGHALANRIDGIRRAHPFASGVSIWREARRRQGRIELVDVGTRFEYAVAGLVHRGWDPYRLGEDSDLTEASQQDDLADELFAHDKRAEGLRRYRITRDRLDLVDIALASRLAVVIGTGTTTALQRYRGDRNGPDVVLDTEYLGGERDGHGQGIFGVVAELGRRRYAVQNSWGSGWGGCHLPGGAWQPGCCWVDESVILEAWDVHVIEVKE